MSIQQTPAVGVPEWDLTDRLRKSLRSARISVQAMADHLEVSRKTVGNYLNGRTAPTNATLRVWAIRCGVPLDWLRHGTETDLDPGGQEVSGRAWNGQVLAFPTTRATGPRSVAA